MNLRRYKLVFLFFLCVFSPVMLQAQLVRHSYRFYNNLSVSAPECGPDLVQAQAPGSCGAPASPGSFAFESLPACGLARTVYHTNMHWGLRYPNSSGAITNTYTIHMYVKNTDWGTHTWARIIDFSNGGADAGIYYKSSGTSADRCLDFYPSGVVGACPWFTIGTYYLLTFTRNAATNIVDVYVNNSLFTSYNDAAGRYVGATGTPIYIYRDDAVVTCESAEANFAYLSFTNQYSNQHTVDSVYNEICTIANAPSADFVFNPTRSCNFPENIQVTYTGSIPPPGTGYTFGWNWDGGTVVSGTGMGPFIISWPTPGVKNVTLTITNISCGTTTSSSHTISLSSRTPTSISQTICSGQSYQGYTATGTYNDTFPLPAGCDSIRILNLTVNPPVVTNISQTICSGQSYLGYSATGNYNDTFATTAGCDSVRILHLTVTPPVVTNTSQAICSGRSFEGYNVTGIYTDTFSTASGCDSVRILNLTVIQPVTTHITQSICAGQSYEGHSTTGTYNDTFSMANGCDSVRVLHLTVNPVTHTTVDHSICTGQSYMGYSVAGTYRDTFPAANGCDSIRTLNLTVLTDPLPQLGNDRLFCTGDSIILEPGVFNSYIWQDGSTSNVYIVRRTGLYTVSVTGNCGVQLEDVFITEQPCVISFPSAFSPNGDGLNETFGILHAPALQSYQLIIYNRWGQKIFQSDKAAIGWNGRYNDKLQPNGAYIWYCTFTRNGKESRMRGTILLIR